MGEAKGIGTETDINDGSGDYRNKEARGHQMNSDHEGQYYLSHTYDKLLLNRNLPNVKSTGNSKTSATKSAIIKMSSVSSSCWGGKKKKKKKKKETAVSEASTTLKFYIVWITENEIYLLIHTNMYMFSYTILEESSNNKNNNSSITWLNLYRIDQTW